VPLARRMIFGRLICTTPLFLFEAYLRLFSSPTVV
jgi:hypothetical protein